MKTPFIFVFTVAMLIGSFSVLHSQSLLEYQLRKNLNLGYDLNFGQNFYATNFHVGTGISDRFDGDSRAYWRIGADVNFTRYNLFETYGYSYFEQNSLYRTTSVSFPFILGYEVRKSTFSGVKWYAGPVYNLVITSRLNGQPYYDIQPGQWSFTIGTKMKFLAIFNANLAYNYYPNALFSNGELNRSSLSFSVGF